VPVRGLNFLYHIFKTTDCQGLGSGPRLSSWTLSSPSAADEALVLKECLGMDRQTHLGWDLEGEALVSITAPSLKVCPSVVTHGTWAGKRAQEPLLHHCAGMA
jgi:hypothetical protein